MKKNRTSLGISSLSQRLQALLLLVCLGSTAAAQVLPPPPERPLEAQTLPLKGQLFVREFQFEGNTAFSDAELAKVTEPFTNRELKTEELEEARRAVSLHYVQQGYVNSGAVIPDQDPTNGIVHIRIIEGTLTDIDLSGNKWLRDRYIESRLRHWGKAPLNLTELQQGLQLLRQNPNVKQVNAELKPGTAPGEGVLDVKVTDQQPFRVGLQVDNQRPPSVGQEEISLLLSDLNVTGHGDVLDFRYGIANSSDHGMEFSGADNLEGRYLLPLTRYDTTLDLHGSRLNTSLIEESFTELDITSLTTSYGIALRQPVYQTANQELALSLGFDRRVNDSWLLNERFNISPGAVDGEMVVSVLRFSQEWLSRGQNNVLALRSTFSFGLNAFDATDNKIDGDPNAKFFSWLGQGQYIQRLFNTQNQLVLRLTGQWTSDPLLAIEQISIGGLQTVRGYFENQLVRDTGIASSAEFRIPILFNKAGAGIVQLAPFFDFGGAWNVRQSPSPTTIYSTGVGLLLTPSRHFSAELYWGYRLRDVDEPPDGGPQDLGLHFKINLAAF